MRLSRNQRVWIWLGIGMALRLLLIVFPRTYDDDTSAYLELGRNLLHHGTFGMGSGGEVTPSLFRLPGYPIFLALLGGNLRLVEVIQSGLEMLGWWLVSRVVPQRISEWVLALGAVCVFTAVYSATCLTESLTVFAICLGIFGFGRWVGGNGQGVLAMAGAAGLAMILRPDGVLVFVALLLGMVMKGLGPRAEGLPGSTRVGIGASARAAEALPKPRSQKRDMGHPNSRMGTVVRDLVVICVLACLPLSVWAVRNYRTFGVFQPLAPKHVNDPGERVNLGFYRWLRTWSTEFVTTQNVFWHVGAEPLRMEDVPLRGYDSEAQRLETSALFAIYDGQGNQVDAALDARFGALAEERIQAHPMRYYVWVPALRALDMLFRPRTESWNLDADWWRFEDHYRDSFWALVLGLGNLGYFVLALMGVAKRRVPFGLLLGVYFVMRFCLLGTLENAEARYSVEVFPMLVVAGAGWLGRERKANATTDRTWISHG